VRINTVTCVVVCVICGERYMAGTGVQWDLRRKTEGREIKMKAKGGKEKRNKEDMKKQGR